MSALPNQTPGILPRYGLTRAEVDDEVWAIDGAGRRYGGAAAVNRALAVLGGLWRLPEFSARIPPLFWLERRVYRWVAEHRSRFRFWSSRPECDEPDVECG